MLTSEAFYSLDDNDTLDRLESYGLIIKKGQQAFFKVSTNPSTGFGWIINEDECDDEVVSYDSHIGPDTSNEEANAKAAALEEELNSQGGE